MISGFISTPLLASTLRLMAKRITATVEPQIMIPAGRNISGVLRLVINHTLENARQPYRESQGYRRLDPYEPIMFCQLEAVSNLWEEYSKSRTKSNANTKYDMFCWAIVKSRRRGPDSAKLCV